MNDVSPAGRGSRRLPGGRHSEGSESRWPPTDPERDLRCSTRARCQAVLAELEVQPPDWDLIATLLAGAIEDIEAS
jgi:hypothetical protein